MNVEYTINRELKNNYAHEQSALNGKNRIVLYFDVDQTLVEVFFRSNQNSSLSQSAYLDLSRSGEGVIKNPVLLKIENKSYRAKKIAAFAKDEFSAIFSAIRDANREKELPPVLVRILTNATYSQNELISCLNHFYGDITIDGYANGKRAAAGKGEEMASDYKSLYESIGIPKNNIYLIDDSESNCADAEREGFKAIRMGTTPQFRGEKTYSESKQMIFSTLLEIIAKAQE